MTTAIFLDRDGVIIENRSDYVRSWSDVFVFPQALTALALLSRLPTKIFVVTNQSAVGRGMIDLDAVHHINQRLLDIIVQNSGRVDDFYVCPHLPSDRCTCRKPEPGLILQAARQFQIDLSKSFLVGDALSDIQAAQNAGIINTYLVRTGRGAEQATMLLDSPISGCITCNDLLAAAQLIIARDQT